MRYFQFIASFILVALLSACGGGGGSPGLSSSSTSTFTVVAPSAVTLQVGTLQPYAVKGGVKPYSVFSSDPAVAIGWISGDDYVYVGTGVAGKATVTVVDAKNTKFDLAVTSGSSTALFTTAASTMTITPGVANAQTYSIGGGTPPYVVTSNFPSIVKVTNNGNQMTITGVQIDLVNDATITVRDSAGATVLTVVSVRTTEFKLTPGAADSATIYVGDVMNLMITGGTPPYRILEPIGGVFDGSIINGNQVQMIGNRVADGVQLNVVDASNQSAAGPKVKIVTGQDVLRISPSTLSIPENTNTPNINLNIFGVAAGSTLQVFTTDRTVLVPGTPVKANTNGTSYTLQLSGGSTCSLAPAAGIDNSVPPNGTFTDPGDVPAVTGGDRTVTITVLDSSGRQGTSAITIKDSNGKGGC